MKFKECSIAGKKMKTDQIVNDTVSSENEQDPDSIRPVPSSSSRGFNSRNPIKLDDDAKLFFASMAVCHTVIPETGPDGALSYNASSPDEKALVEGKTFQMRYFTVRNTLSS